jgi:GAF domain-containing protein
VLCFGPAASPEAAGTFAGHAAFIAVFALLNVVFLHAEVARQRREHKQLVNDEVEAMREEARDFRLISTALSPESRVRTRAEEQEKLSQGSIQTIHEQLYYNLDLVRGALGLQTCALLWLDETGERLKVKELCTDSTHVVEGAIAAGVGVLGAILKELRPFTLEAPRLSLLPYYAGPAEVGAFLGVPVVEGRSARGILVGDRADARKFEPADVTLVTAAAAQVVRVVQSERVFQALERSKHEHERFHQASAELNRALTLDQVYDAAIAGARGVCEFEFACIATYEARRGSHTIRRVVGEGSDKLLGTSHKDPSSIASMVAKNKLALPAGGDWHERDVPVFSHPMRIKDYESLLVVPLIVKDEVIGTFTVAATRAGAFPSDRRVMLGVIANQVAVSMQNARMYEALEEQATTDGPHRPGQSPHLPGTVLDHAGAGRAPRPGGVAAADRHRSLQEDQRHLRPPDRRRGAAPGRRDPEGERAQDRHRRALRRRGVRAGAGGNDRAGARSWPSASARRSSSSRSRRRRARSARRCPSASPATPTTRARSPRSSRAPTSRCTAPSTAAATAPSASATSTAS